jgi:hypothetical protein
MLRRVEIPDGRLGEARIGQGRHINGLVGHGGSAEVDTLAVTEEPLVGSYIAYVLPAGDNPIRPVVIRAGIAPIQRCLALEPGKSSLHVRLVKLGIVWRNPRMTINRLGL